MGDGPCCFLAPPFYFFSLAFFFILPDERGPVGAAGPARCEAHKQRRQGGKWEVAWRGMLAALWQQENSL
jgi:hypothetical protein